MAENKILNDQFFEQLVERTATEEHATSCVKSRLYTALLEQAESEQALRPLSETKQAGYGLCWWEKAMEVLPGETINHFNHCRVCHGRLVGENLEDLPLPWAHCPHAEFKK
jgi:hypothetical protein